MGDDPRISVQKDIHAAIKKAADDHDMSIRELVEPALLRLLAELASDEDVCVMPPAPSRIRKSVQKRLEEAKAALGKHSTKDSDADNDPELALSKADEIDDVYLNMERMFFWRRKRS